MAGNETCAGPADHSEGRTHQPSRSPRRASPTSPARGRPRLRPRRPAPPAARLPPPPPRPQRAPPAPPASLAAAPLAAAVAAATAPPAARPPQAATPPVAPPPAARPATARGTSGVLGLVLDLDRPLREPPDPRRRPRPGGLLLPTPLARVDLGLFTVPVMEAMVDPMTVMGRMVDPMAVWLALGPQRAPQGAPALAPASPLGSLALSPHRGRAPPTHPLAAHGHQWHTSWTLVGSL